MADDHSQRAYRSNEFSRAPAKSGGANDPLAELARLIGQNDPFAEFGRQPQAPTAAQQPAAQQQYGQPPHDQWAPQPYPTQNYDERGDFHAGHAQAGYDQPPAYDGDYQDDPYRETDQAYDDEPPRRRRGTIIAIAAVVALAVVGTAGAVGYRALFGSSGNSPPPVIKADVTPTKVVPATKSEPQSNKLIYDRVGERNSGERLVSREEEPLDISKSSQGAFPNVIAANQQMAVTSGAAGIASVDQPKKIHTIPIRPDQPMTAAEPVQATRAAAVAAPAPLPPRAAPPPQQQRVATADAEDAPVTRSTPPRSAAPSRGAPLSLSPNAAAPAPQPEPVRTASAPATRNAPPTATSANGQYAVQISSQRSEAEAQAAFRALQAKYPSQLGGRQPLIRRADLGSKGIFYRALVGPFANGSDAVDLCQSLKSAGGSCLIQKN
jgi:hypothetical protein